ncbi:ABC transporter permease [Halobacteriales archaeon QS_5_68_33]|jgi:peptide/nickel transport system permease protein|nr:MAG: ABC transporter permease [Halobacteriales archaeon QS_5_68_33]
MATQRPERFDQVNWEEVAGAGRFSLSTNAKGLLVTTIPLLALAAYDWLVLDERTPTFEPVGLNVDVPILDYMFAFTLLLFAFYVVLPLYQHPRLTKYYWREFRRNRPAVVSLVWLGVVFVLGLVGPLLITSPEQNVLHSYQPPVYLSVNAANAATCAGEVVDGMCFGTWQYPLGTTRAGKGVFAMLVNGFGITLKIGFISTFIAVVLGASVGTVSAYAGGWVDEILMRYVDIQGSWPTLIMYLLIIYTFGGRLWLLILLLGTFSWEGMARYVRSKALSISEEEYIKAINMSGASAFRVVRRHVVPNSASSIITDITLLIPGFLLAEAQLSFLGLGDTSVDSWGQIIAGGRDALAFAPWIVLAPGLVLFLTILAFNFVGDALLDALNPEAAAEAER